MPTGATTTRAGGGLPADAPHAEVGWVGGGEGGGAGDEAARAGNNPRPHKTGSDVLTCTWTRDDELLSPVFMIA